MKHTFHLKSMVLGVILGAIIMFSVAAATSGGRVTWDYTETPGHP